MAVNTAVQQVLTAIQGANGNTATTGTNNTSQPINVYGTGIDLQNAKNVLGATGTQYNFIDTGKPGFTNPTAYNASDVVLGGVGTVGGIAGDIGPASRLAGADASGTLQALQNYGIQQQYAPYVNQVQQAIQQSQQNRPAIPTYDYNQDVTDINNLYQQQQEAMQTRLEGQTQAGVNNLNFQMQQALPQYQTAKNQVDVTYNQEQRKANESLANQGLARAGKQLTTQAILGASRVNQIGALTQQQQQFVNTVNFQINQLKQQGLTEENAQIKELEAQKTQALLQARQTNFDRQLQVFNISENRSQQDLQNMINGIQFAYGVSKDTANEIFQNNQFNWQKAQAEADKAFRQAQFDYQKEQDKIQQAFQERQITDQEKQQALDNAYRQQQLKLQQAAALSSAAKKASSGSSNSGYTADDVTNRLWGSFQAANSAGQGQAWLDAHSGDVYNSGVPNANKIVTDMQNSVVVPQQQAPAQPSGGNWLSNAWNTIKSWF